MNENERYWHFSLDANEIQQVENIACELGYYDLEEDEFRY